MKNLDEYCDAVFNYSNKCLQMADLLLSGKEDTKEFRKLSKEVQQGKREVEEILKKSK